MGSDEIILWGLHQFTFWGVLATDAQLNITDWNHWLEVHTGHAKGAVIGRNLLDVFPELVERRFDRLYRRTLTGSVALLSQRLHKHLIRIPPSERDSPFDTMRQSVRIAPLIEKERVVGTLTLIEDVSERVAFEEELAAQARQQAALALLGQRALAGGELPALMAKAVTFAAETLGLEFGEILELLPEEKSLARRAAFGWPCGEADAPPTPEADPRSLAHQVLHSDGLILVEDLKHEARFRGEASLPPGLTCGAAVKIGSGEKPFGLLAVYANSCRLFTENNLQFLQTVASLLELAIQRKQLETALRDRAADLAQADRLKDEFLAMLAHELRNPLAPIHNAVQVLEMGAGSEANERWAREVIDRQVQQMTRLIDDLMDVSRITRGKIICRKEPVELAAIVARALETSRPAIDARKHELVVSLPKQPLFLEGDIARLAQVLGNLLNNAAKYTPEGGKIELIGEANRQEIVLRVRDTGVGIPAEMLPNIFDLFTQVERTIDRAEGGLGIGLTLVRRLTELHGGRVEVFSPGPDRGSEFVVHLPRLVEGTEIAASRDAENRVTRPPAARRILVVDDNEDSAESLAMLLRIQGHQVHTAHDGLAALHEAAAIRPDVALLDIGLPGIDGYEVARRLRRQPETAETLLVAMTGYGQDEDRRLAREAGFDQHLVKPVDLEALRRLLASQRC